MKPLVANDEFLLSEVTQVSQPKSATAPSSSCNGKRSQKAMSLQREMPEQFSPFLPDHDVADMTISGVHHAAIRDGAI